MEAENYLFSYNNNTITMSHPLINYLLLIIFVTETGTVKWLIVQFKLSMNHVTGS